MSFKAHIKVLETETLAMEAFDSAVLRRLAACREAHRINFVATKAKKKPSTLIHFWELWNILNGGQYDLQNAAGIAGTGLGQGQQDSGNQGQTTTTVATPGGT